MKKTSLLLGLALFSVVFLSACDKNSEENIVENWESTENVVETQEISENNVSEENTESTNNTTTNTTLITYTINVNITCAKLTIGITVKNII